MKTKLSLSKEKIKILLLENIHPQAKIILDQNGYHNVESIDSAISQSDLISKIKSVHMLGIRSRTIIDQKILNQADKLFAIEIINEKNLSLMQKDACLINASRGRVVNIGDL